MNRGSSNAGSPGKAANKSPARAIRAHPSAQRDRSPVDHLREEQPVVGSPRLDAKRPGGEHIFAHNFFVDDFSNGTYKDEK